MNWRRGLFRLWVAGSGAWLVLFAGMLVLADANTATAQALRGGQAGTTGTGASSTLNDGLLAYYDAATINGKTWPDLSGHGSHGTINGPVQVDAVKGLHLRPTWVARALGDGSEAAWQGDTTIVVIVTPDDPTGGFTPGGDPPVGYIVKKAGAGLYFWQWASVLGGRRPDDQGSPWWDADTPRLPQTAGAQSMGVLAYKATSSITAADGTLQSSLNGAPDQPVKGLGRIMRAIPGAAGSLGDGDPTTCFEGWLRLALVYRRLLSNAEQTAILGGARPTQVVGR